MVNTVSPLNTSPSYALPSNPLSNAQSLLTPSPITSRLSNSPLFGPVLTPPLPLYFFISLTSGLAKLHLPLLFQVHWAFPLVPPPKLMLLRSPSSAAMLTPCVAPPWDPWVVHCHAPDVVFYILKCACVIEVLILDCL